MHSEIRWKQDVRNYKTILLEIKLAFEKNSLSSLELQGIIYLFRLNFNIACKILKDKLSFEGCDVNSPRSTIKKAYELGILENGQAWLEMLESRNLFTHTYSGKLADEAVQSIKTIRHY